MAVISVEPLFAEGGGSVKERRYESHWQVISNDQNDSPNVIRNNFQLPFYNDTFRWAGDFDNGSIVLEKVAKLRSRGESRLLWDVTVTYGPSTKICSTVEIDNPLDEPPQVSGGFAQFSKAIDKDLDDEPIASSAGEPFDPPLEIDDSRPTISVTRNEGSIDLGFLADYRDAVNSDAIWGLSPGQVKVASITWSRNYRGNCSPYYSITYEFHITADSWQRKVVDRGFYKKVTNAAGDVVKELIKDRFDQPLNQPSLLDGAGELLPDGDDPVMIDFRVYEERPFSALGLPTL